MNHVAVFRRSSTTHIVVSTQRVSWGLLGNVNFNRSHAWFCLLFPPSLGCLSKRRQQERMKRWWGWVESFLLSHSQRMSFSSIDHAAFTGLEKLRVVCNLFFSRRSGINSVTNLAVSDIHGRLRALISIFLSCHWKTNLCSVHLLEDIYCLGKKKSNCWTDETN